MATLLTGMKATTTTNGSTAQPILAERGPGGPPRRHDVRLSVIMAAYNEERTVRAAAESVLAVDLPCELELIVVDDGSTDRTASELQAITDPRLRAYRHPTNLGKGTAMATGRRLATGTHIVPFDADLEYAADDLRSLVQPVIDHGCPVVLGTRNGGRPATYASFRYALGNRVLTGLANALFGADISDLHTCLKLVSADLLQTLPLRAPGFGGDTELMAAMLRRGIKPYEVPITYQGRSIEEGKKIGWKDAAECCALLVKHRVVEPQDLPQPRVVIDLTGHSA